MFLFFPFCVFCIEHSSLCYTFYVPSACKTFLFGTVTYVHEFLRYESAQTGQKKRRRKITIIICVWLLVFIVLFMCRVVCSFSFFSLLSSIRMKIKTKNLL